MSYIPGTPRAAKDGVAVESCWMTPRWLLARVCVDVMGGGIDLDPCTIEANPVGAKMIFTPTTDGLGSDWPVASTVFVNPPFIEAAKWAAKSVAESKRLHLPRIVFLGPASIGTAWFHALWENSDDALFLSKRIRFDGIKVGSPTRGTVLFGLNCSLKRLNDLGTRGIAA